MSLEDTIKSQLTRGYRYCSERPAERVFQSRGQIVGQTELDPEADDLAENREFLIGSFLPIN